MSNKENLIALRERIEKEHGHYDWAQDLVKELNEFIANPSKEAFEKINKELFVRFNGSDFYAEAIDAFDLPEVLLDANHKSETAAETKAEETETKTENKTQGLTFFEAIEALKQGKIVNRERWKDGYLHLSDVLHIKFSDGYLQPWILHTTDISESDWRIVF